MAEAVDELFKAQSQAASTLHFQAPDAYAGLTHNPGGYYMGACIHPTLPLGFQRGSYPVMIQTPGGEVGVATDLLTVDQAVYGISPTHPSNGFLASIKNVARRFKNVYWSGHHGCAFIGNLDAITSEMENPSDFTMQRVLGWAQQLGELDEVRHRMTSIRKNMAVGREALLGYQEDRLLGEASHVLEVEEPNVSVNYLVNLGEYWGINNNARHHDRRLQAYHDSVGAFKRLLAEASMDGIERSYRLGAMMLRSAATLHTIVVASGRRDQFTIREVRAAPATKHGIQIIEAEY